MKIARLILLVCAFSATSFAGLRVSLDLGGSSSYLAYEFHDTSQIEVDSREWVNSVVWGAHFDVSTKDIFGLSVGILLEDKGSILKGNASIFDGEYKFEYRFLQIPVHGKFIIPLLVPGSITLAAGPEFGFVLDRSWVVKLGNLVIEPDWEDYCSDMDFGISGRLAYEAPIGRYLGFQAWGAYYYGLVDLFKSDDPALEDFDIFNRTITFGASIYILLMEF
ncbi:MAG: hypothetical protein JW768_01355 [Chitinispirillaceae bacterium]|nr:hypothetical protein [Chitinispirillaceae bacterium]